MIQYKDFLEKLKPHILQVQKDRKMRSENGELFNIFPILRKLHDEEYLHSAFLAELLSPAGNHGQGSVFLEFFVEECCPDYKELDCKYAKLVVEHSAGAVNIEMTEGGKIDLLIESGHSAIVIENKIYAHDQVNQLLRYANFAQQQYKNHILLYLTLYRDKPAIISLGGVDVEYKCISYKYEILHWLERCIEYSKDKPMIRAVIQQYADLLKTLTGQSTGETMNEKILDLIKSDEAYADCVVELIKVVNSLESDVISKFDHLLTTRINETIELSDDKSIRITQVEDRDGLCICIDLLYKSGDKVCSTEERRGYIELFYTLYPQKVKSNDAYIAWYNPEVFGNGKGFETLSLDKKIEIYMSESKLNELIDVIVKEKNDIVTSFKNAIKSKQTPN